MEVYLSQYGHFLIKSEILIMLTILAHRVDYKKYHYLVLIVCNCKERKLSLFSEVP